MPGMNIFRSKKRSVSFKDERDTASLTYINKNVENMCLSMQRCASLFDLPVRQQPATRDVFYPHPSHQSETEKLTQSAEKSTQSAEKLTEWKIRNSSVAHSKSPQFLGGTPKRLNNLNASSLVNQQLPNRSATTRPLPASSSAKIQTVSNNSKTTTKSGKQVPSLFSPSPSGGPVQSNVPTDTFESFDILNEARKIFRSLSVEISKTLDSVAKSPALPSVIKKYSGMNTADSESSKSVPNQELPRPDPVCTVPKWRNISPSSEHEEFMELLAGLQIRCLEYREMIRDYTVSILAECKHFTELSIPRMKALSDSITRLKDNFSNFKELCKNHLKNAEPGREGFPYVFTDFMQVTLLYTLEEQNESFLTRLQSGVDLIRAHCKFVRYENAASLRMETLMKELEDVRRVSVGYRV